MASALDPNREAVRLIMLERQMLAGCAARKERRLTTRSPAGRKAAATAQHNAYARDALINGRVDA